MGMSDRIEAFIVELLKTEEPNEWLNLKRNELAEIFKCAPSQINYVMSTRFNRERGYIVESRRGGGGYVRIKRIGMKNEELVPFMIRAAGDSLSIDDARAHMMKLLRADIIDERTAAVMRGALADSAVPVGQPERDRIRANIFKNMLAAINMEYK